MKKKPLRFSDLTEFIENYNTSNRHKRTESWSADNPQGRWKRFDYAEIIERDKTNLDIFWLKDDSLADLENLPDPDILASEIVELMEAGLASFREIVEEI